jgi:hypothetical protein
MGTKVLSTTFNGTNKIRAYAHCVKNSVRRSGTCDGNIDGQPGRAKRAGPKHGTARSAWARHGTASVGPVPARPDR